MGKTSLEIFDEARKAGDEAIRAHDANNWFPCGRAYIVFSGTCRFIRDMKKAGIAGGVNSCKDIHKMLGRGYMWSPLLLTQSLAAYELYCRAAVEVFKANGVGCYMKSWID